MPANPVLEKLREQIDCLDQARARFSHTIPVADAIDCGLPYGGLPSGCVHEIKGTSLASTIAFSAVLASRFAGERGHIVYIAPDRCLHPLGLLPYGIKLDRLVHVSSKRPHDLAWAVMESSRCPQVSALIAVLSGLDLTESRRLQLAAETSRVTAFLLGHAASAPVASAITRWRISSVPAKSSQRFDEPTWMVDLAYCRGGRPGKWLLEWRDRQFHALGREPVGQTALQEHAGKMQIA